MNVGLCLLGTFAPSIARIDRSGVSLAVFLAPVAQALDLLLKILFALVGIVFKGLPALDEGRELHGKGIYGLVCGAACGLQLGNPIAEVRLSSLLRSNDPTLAEDQLDQLPLRLKPGTGLTKKRLFCLRVSFRVGTFTLNICHATPNVSDDVAV